MVPITFNNFLLRVAEGRTRRYEGNLMIIAGPGSGKTAVCQQRLTTARVLNRRTGLLR